MHKSWLYAHRKPNNTGNRPTIHSNIRRARVHSGAHSIHGCRTVRAKRRSKVCEHRVCLAKALGAIARDRMSSRNASGVYSAHRMLSTLEYCACITGFRSRICMLCTKCVNVAKTKLAISKAAQYAPILYMHNKWVDLFEFNKHMRKVFGSCTSDTLECQSDFNRKYSV